MSMQQTTNGTHDPGGALMERVIALGDLADLTPRERASYYGRVCTSMGLNPLTQPFMYVRLNGKLTLYAKRDATDQLRKIHSVSVVIAARERTDDLCVVTARATMPDGRTDESVGAVSIAGLKGENLANALMKAETKAKRRVTLSICGLGMLDETEVSDVKSARPVTVTADGEIVETKALPAPAATSDDDWLEWALQHTANMNEAKSPGAMKEAYFVAVKEAKARAAPKSILEALEAAKDKLKSTWDPK